MTIKVMLLGEVDVIIIIKSCCVWVVYTFLFPCSSNKCDAKKFKQQRETCLWKRNDKTRLANKQDLNGSGFFRDFTED